MSYSLSDYCDMIGDDVRVKAYSQAMAAVITPDSCVLDVGCGSGFFALLACKMGARHVYGIEPNEAVSMARMLAKLNGFDDRTTFYNNIASDVELPEKVDIIVSDLRGALPLYSNHFDVIRDVRERFLKPGGTLLPGCDSVYMVPVSDTVAYTKATASWLSQTSFGLDLSPIEANLRNIWQSVTLTPESIVGEPCLWETLDYRCDLPKTMSNLSEWLIEEAITLHGIGVWFDCLLLDSIGYSASPFSQERPTVYGNAFFPFESPLGVEPGDTLKLSLTAHSLEGDYMMAWDTELTHGETRTAFSQTTLAATGAWSPDFLHKRADNYTPVLNENGAIDCLILQGISDGMNLGGIARNIADHFPHRFTSWQKALGHVGTLASAYDKK